MFDSIPLSYLGSILKGLAVLTDLATASVSFTRAFLAVHFRLSRRFGFGFSSLARDHFIFVFGISHGM